MQCSAIVRCADFVDNCNLDFVYLAMSLCLCIRCCLMCLIFVDVVILKYGISLSVMLSYFCVLLQLYDILWCHYRHSRIRMWLRKYLLFPSFSTILGNRQCIAWYCGMYLWLSHIVWSHWLWLYKDTMNNRFLWDMLKTNGFVCWVLDKSAVSKTCVRQIRLF